MKHKVDVLSTNLFKNIYRESILTTVTVDRNFAVTI